MSIMDSAINSIYYVVTMSIQVTIHLPRCAHSTTTVNFCPGLEDVISIGGSPDFDADRPEEDEPRIAETMILTFGELSQY